MSSTYPRISHDWVSYDFPKYPRIWWINQTIFSNPQRTVTKPNTYTYLSYVCGVPYVYFSVSRVTFRYNHIQCFMMTSSNGNIFRVTGRLCGEFTGHRWIPLTRARKRRRALMFSLICAWVNGCINNREAGDLGRHRAHYDVIAMWMCISSYSLVKLVNVWHTTLASAVRLEQLNTFVTQFMSSVPFFKTPRTDFAYFLLFFPYHIIYPHIQWSWLTNTQVYSKNALKSCPDKALIISIGLHYKK